MPANEIARGVFAVGGPELSDIHDAYSYIVDFDGAQVMIDCGAASDCSKLLANAERALGAKPNIRTVVLTHNHIDHVGGAAALRSRTGARIAAHEHDAPALESGDPERTAASWYGADFPPLPLDIILGGEAGSIEGADDSLSFIHTPGHTPGSICILLERDGKKILFGQDIHGPFLPQFASDAARWRESMKKLLSLEPDILCEGHYGFFMTKDRAAAFIRSYLDKV